MSRPSDEQSQRFHNHLAFWAGATAFFGNLAAISVIDLLGAEAETIAQVTAVVLTALFVGLVTFSKQKWDDARKLREGGG